MLCRYTQAFHCRLLVLTHPPDDQLKASLRGCRYAFLDTQDAEFQRWLPGATLVRGRTYRNLGNVFVLDPKKI